MKKFTILFLVAAFILSTVSYAQKTKNAPAEEVNYRIDNMGYWKRMAAQGLVPYNAEVPVKPAEYKGSHIESKGVMIADSPDVPVTSLTNVTESENSVFIDPDNNQYVLNSNNSTSWSGGSVGTLYGANYFQTSNGGSSWGGSASGAGGSNSGDPAAAIGRNGRQFVNYISNAGGQGIAYSDNGTSWSTATVGPNPGDLADKNHMWIDNSLTSPYSGYLYAAWTDFGGSYDYRVVLTRSTNNGVTWSTRIPISNASTYFSHGVNLQTGPNGEVYACWATYPSGSLTENAIGFNKSTNGGSSFGTATTAISNIKGIRATGVLKNMRVNSFPVMAVDISGGPNNGTIYIVWTNIGTPGTNTGTNKSVYIIKSTNGGTSWSTPVKVNQGAFTNGKEAYLPWITCDIETGALAVVFYDDRNTSSSSCETWVAYSTNAGSTWTDFRVSDVSFTPNAIPGLASSYMGDYLGITSKGGRVYPCWTDTRNGLYMTYVSPFTLGLNADFTANNTTICSGSSVTFTDASGGPPTSWSWTFTGGTPSSYSGQNPPAITYSTPGTYNVSLTVGNGITNDTETKTGYITVNNVIADFAGTPTTVVVGNTVTFTDNSSCSPTAWSWTFTGGTPSTATGPGPHVITYNTVGTYNASLTVTKASSTDTETKTGYINVINAVFNMTNGTFTTCSGNFYDSGGSGGSYANNENFTSTFYPATPGAKIRFTFSSFSTESGYDYLRIYDGINTSATLIGTYNGTTGPGTVTATNATGALTFNFTSDYSVTATGWAAAISCFGSATPPVANFTASPTTPAVGQTVTFTDQSTNTPTSWTWSFSPSTVTYVGGTTSASQNPQLQFNAGGYYTVTLTATNSAGSDGETKTNYIFATAPPVANFIAGTTTPAVGQTVTFTDQSTNTPTSWAWSFSPSTVTYVGGTTSASQNPQVQFNAGGFYTVTLTATNAAGSDGETKTNYINVSNPPVADFDADTYAPIIGQTVYFWDASTNYPTSWSWSFSPSTVVYVGGTNQNSMEPEVQFTAGGLYTVTLTATNAGGSDTETKVNFISVYYPPVANFSANTTTPNIGQTVNFTDLTTNNPYQWTWSFTPSTVTYTGGTTATSQNPKVIFNAGGFYTVTLTSTSVGGTDTEVKTNYINVPYPPVADFDADSYTPVIGQTVYFWDMSTNLPTSWSWTFTPPTVTYTGGTSATSMEPAVIFNAGGSYTVTLTATNGSGSDTETKVGFINVPYPPVTDFAASTTTPYIGQTVNFTDLTTNSPYLWTWSFSPSTVTYTGGTNSFSQNPQVQFTAGGSYTITLTATNSGGTDTEEKIGYITVQYPPVADFMADNTTPATGESVSFTDLSTNSPTSWSWIFNPSTVIYAGGTTETTQNPQVQFTAGGTYTVTLTATNASGNDSETKIDYITVQNPIIELDLTVYLEGPFNGTDMTPSLNGILPLTQPYNTTPWNYAGTESVATIPNASVLDWVLIELRDAGDASSATSTSMMDRKAGFLLNNGKVVDMDGTSNLQFSNSLTQQLYVVIWHRNHLGVMTSNTLTESGGTYTYNFTTGATQAYGSTDAHKQIGPGVWGMIGGDGDKDGEILTSDKSPLWDIQTGTQGYLESDYNLDTQTDNKDKDDIWAPNQGAGSQVLD